MAASLGEKIKALRIELKMTQTELAGSEMTKSMLSQIENNTAMPSMKNLQYLAARLGKPASFFLEQEENRENFPIDDIQREMKEAESLYRMGRYAETADRLKQIGEKYKLDRDSKLYGDYLTKYGEVLIDLNRVEEATAKIEEATRIYEQKYLFIDAAKVYLFLCGVPWNSFQYEKCLDILEQGIEIYNKSINRDYAFEIDLLYKRSIFTASLDRIDDGIKATEEALKISGQTNIYYRTDELYKNMAVLNAFRGRYDNFDYYLEKAEKFAEATDNNIILSTIWIVKAKYNNDSGNPEGAIDHLNKALAIANHLILPLINTEFSKSYFLLENYEKALDYIRLIKYPDYIPSKHDYAYIWSSKTMEGLCYLKTGKKQEALAAIREGIEKLEVIGASGFLSDAYKAASEIYSDIGAYEEAFSALKKSNDVYDKVKAAGLYY